MSKRNSYLNEINRHIYLYGVIFAVVYVLLNAVSFQVADSSLCAEDVLISNLLGYSNVEFNLTEFIKYSLFFIVPIFIVGSVAEKEKRLCNAQITIRYEKRRKWERLFNRNIDAFLLVYYIVFVSAMLLAYVFVNHSNGGGSVFLGELAKYLSLTKTQIYQLVFASMCLKFFELFYCKSLYLFCSKWVSNNVAAFVLTFSGYILAIVFKSQIFFSLGVSSLYNIAELITKFGFNTAIVTAMSVLIIKIIFVEIVNFVWRKKR